MAKPRIFVSSTFFDLRVIRADLERFIKEVGYEPVLFERGHIPYSKDQPLEEDCYREIDTCDILIAIIGGKYGTQSIDQKHSITQKELKTAIDLKKQIYIFVEKSVHAEYRTYQLNKSLKDFKASSVNDTRVFNILEEIYALPVGNPIEAFEISENITHFLREQWAGLFQRLLKSAEREQEILSIKDITETAHTLKTLVTYVTEQQKKGDQAIKDILLSSHPAFAAIKTAAKISYRVVFHNLSELDSLLSARGYKQDMRPLDKNNIEWDHPKLKEGIRVKKSIFDKNDNLKIFTPEEWKKEWISTYDFNNEPDDDEIPL